MSSLVTRRLLEASAVLEPADRALLNLWIHRGLDDERLAELTGMDARAVGARRARIVTVLGANLGLPETEVLGALSRIEPEDRADAPPEVQAEAVRSPLEPEPEPELTNGQSPSAPATTAPSGPRRLWAAIAGAVVVAVIVVIVLLSTGSSQPASPRAGAGAGAGLTTAADAGSTTAASTAAPPSSTGTRLGAFPGGLTHTTGSIVLHGHSPHLRLTLTVKDLPAVSSGHYEVWLFSSVVHSQRLGPIGAGTGSVTFPLPAGAGRYHWIDVTLQPRGSTSYSGESELRARNPVDAPPSLRHGRAAPVSRG